MYTEHEGFGIDIVFYMVLEIAWSLLGLRAIFGDTVHDYQ